MNERLIAKKVELVKAIDQYNELLKAKSLDEMNRLEAEVSKLEAEYNEDSQNAVFSECKKAADPLLEGVKRFTYPSMDKDDNGRPTTMVLVEGRERQINLVKLCKYCELPTLWQYRIEEMGELLCLRMAKALGVSAAGLREISKTYRMDKKAKRMHSKR